MAGKLSTAQAEAVVLASQRHAQMLPNGSRAGFYLADGALQQGALFPRLPQGWPLLACIGRAQLRPCAGAGVGKGRTIAAIILDNRRCGRDKSVWVTASKDLFVDAKRDIDALGARTTVAKLADSSFAQLDSVQVWHRPISSEFMLRTAVNDSRCAFSGCHLLHASRHYRSAIHRSCVLAQVQREMKLKQPFTEGVAVATYDLIKATSRAGKQQKKAGAMFSSRFGAADSMVWRGGLRRRARPGR